MVKESLLAALKEAVFSSIELLALLARSWSSSLEPVTAVSDKDDWLGASCEKYWDSSPSELTEPCQEEARTLVIRSCDIRFVQMVQFSCFSFFFFLSTVYYFVVPVIIYILFILCFLVHLPNTDRNI